jgi:hypothetical protein
MTLVPSGAAELQEVPYAVVLVPVQVSSPLLKSVVRIEPVLRSRVIVVG